MTSLSLRVVACCALVALAIRPATAQDTRAATIAAQQAAKAADLHPYEPTKAEKIMNKVQRLFVEPPAGLFPVFGSVYGGGGMTLGAGYRRYYGDRASWEAKALYSIKNYKLVEVATMSPGHLLGRLAVGANVGWRDAPSVGFWGLGVDTASGDRTSFRLQEGYGSAWAQFKPVPWVVLGERATVEDYTIEGGRGRYPSIETAFTPATAPGLLDDPMFFHAATTAAIDTRTSPGYTRTGGTYGVTLHNYIDRDDTYSFNRVDANVVQHLPILRENWVLSLRGNLQTTLGDDDLVPYFLMPSLGNSTTLRGYHSWRFRDRHSVLTSAEFRWVPSRLAMDMAVFYDAGKVVSRREDLDLKGLVHDIGVGVRFHAPGVTILRTELAKGRDGWLLVIAAGPAF